MHLCGGGMGLSPGGELLAFESILSVPGPMCFSRLTSPLQSVLNKHLATSYLPGHLKDNTHTLFLSADSGAQCSLQLALGCGGKCKVFHGAAITAHAT